MKKSGFAGEPLQVKLRESEYQDLVQRAQREGVTESEIVRDALDVHFAESLAEPSRPVQVRLAPEELARVMRRAAGSNLTKADVIREAVRDYLYRTGRYEAHV